MARHSTRGALALIGRGRRKALALLALALAGALAAPSTSTIAMAASNGRGGDGGGHNAGGDINGNHSAVRVGNGKNTRNYVVYGSLKSGNGLQQATVSLNGPNNAQGNFCKRRPRACYTVQNGWLSIGTNNSN